MKAQSDDSYFFLTEVTEVVGKIPTGKVPEVDEICPGRQNGLDFVWLAWITGSPHVLFYTLYVCVFNVYTHYMMGHATVGDSTADDVLLYCLLMQCL